MISDQLKRVDVKLLLSGLLELSGIAAITGGVYLISPIAALIIGGVALIALGLALDPPKRPLKDGNQ